MKYVKSISLFFIYPLCCFLLGVYLGGKTPGQSVENETRDAQGNEVFQEETVGESKESQTPVMQKPEQLTETIEQQVKPVEQNEVLQEGYFVTFLNGHVTVYYMDRETMYLFTEIMAGELPEDVQMDLEQGIVMPDEGTLFSFLENYTS